MRLLEQNLLQLRGFRNQIEGEETIGFNVPIRLKYYRGLWASQLREATVTVNDVIYQGTQIYWTIEGKKIEQENLKDYPNIHWSSMETATLTIRKKGGLNPGIYNIKVSYDFSSSYLPPAIDTGFFDTSGERNMVLVC